MTQRASWRGTIVFAGHRTRYLTLGASVGAFSILAACADSRGGPIPYNQPLAAPDAPSLATLAADYKIAPMDKLAIRVFKADDFTGDYDVDLSGHISLPLIGEVEAANLTTAELDQKLTEKLGEKYLEHPDVSVSIKQSSGRLITIDGAVKSAGSFPVLSSMTLMQAVALARGTTEDANPRRVAIFRTINGKRQAAAFDLTSIRRGEAQDPAVFAGDIVVVDGSRVKAVERQILQTVPLLAIFGPL
jgi:polysaccharide biosynthesis/export protein